MRVLHTSDWHVGRTVRGLSRDDEHRAVLVEITDIVARERIDLVLVAGDVFDHAVPGAGAEQIVYEALLAMTKAGAKVAMVAGNHDNQRKFEAVRPLLALASVAAEGSIVPASEGGCIELGLRGGEVARLAMIPWASQRGVVRAADLMEREQAEHQNKYRDYWRRISDALCAGFDTRAVNILLSHVCVGSAIPGGGERSSEMIEGYFVDSQNIPVTVQYAALGHIHRGQAVPAPCPAWYSGSPLQLDFGEQSDAQGVLVFEAKAGLPVGDVRRIPLRAGKRLLTVRGSLDELRARSGEPALADAFLRLVVEGQVVAGAADDLRERFPNAVEVRLAPVAAADTPAGERPTEPRDLFRAYLEATNAFDERLLALFDELLEEDARATAAS